MKLRQYTKEFKIQAAELAESLGSVVEASQQLGVPQNNIYKWSKIYGRRDSKTQAELPSDELQRLRRENVELKQVNHILSKATAFFSQDRLK